MCNTRTNICETVEKNKEYWSIYICRIYQFYYFNSKTNVNENIYIKQLQSFVLRSWSSIVEHRTNKLTTHIYSLYELLKKMVLFFFENSNKWDKFVTVHQRNIQPPNIELFNVEQVFLIQLFVTYKDTIIKL